MIDQHGNRVRRAKPTTAPPAPWRNRILRLEHVDPRRLQANPRNFRVHPTKQQTALAGAIQELGFLDPITAQDGTDLIIDGHLRVAEAIKNKEATVPVIYLDLTDEEANAALASIDPIGNLADHNRELLADLLGSLKTRNRDLATFYTDLANAEGIVDPTGTKGETGAEDHLPERPTLTRSNPGDLWLLGPHRLLVGDARDPENHAKLMAGELADILITDPPYGVGYVGKTKDALTLTGDRESSEATQALVREALQSCRLRPGAPFYLFSPPGYLELRFRMALEEAGLLLRQSLVWIKQIFVMGHSDYHYRHEPILYGWVDGAPHWFLADRTTETVIDDNPDPVTLNRTELLALIKQLRKDVIDSAVREDRPHRSTNHPTMKPVALYTRFIYNSTRPGAKLLDVFAGSGTCLIAGEVTGRQTYAMELDPAYCDVAVTRWEEYTGETATKA